jgi:hypothetical protein
MTDSSFPSHKYNHQSTEFAMNNPHSVTYGEPATQQSGPTLSTIVFCGISACQRNSLERTSELALDQSTSPVGKNKAPDSPMAKSPPLLVSGDRVWQAKIQVWDDMTEAIKNDAPQATFDRIAQRLIEVVRQEKKLNLSVQEQIDLETKYMPLLREANSRMNLALSMNPTEKFIKADFGNRKAGAKP